jgi:hypothetical protein
VLEPTIYRTREEQANRYAIDVVLDDLVLFNKNDIAEKLLSLH